MISLPSTHHYYHRVHHHHNNDNKIGQAGPRESVHHGNLPNKKAKQERLQRRCQLGIRHSWWYMNIDIMELNITSNFIILPLVCFNFTQKKNPDSDIKIMNHLLKLKTQDSLSLYSSNIKIYGFRKLIRFDRRLLARITLSFIN